mgnify:CR=1 FL=1
MPEEEVVQAQQQAALEEMAGQALKEPVVLTLFCPLSLQLAVVVAEHLAALEILD